VCQKPKEPELRGQGLAGERTQILCFGPLCSMETQYTGRVLSESELNPLWNRDGRVARRIIAVAGAGGGKHRSLSGSTGQGISPGC